MAALDTNLRRAAVALALAGALAGAGCVNPFEPTTPEPPDATGLVTDFSRPGRVLETLAAAIARKDPAGRQAWVEAMADSIGPGTRAFYAFHDPRVLSAWRLGSPVDPPEPWDLQLERRFYDHFVSQYDYDYAMAFGPDNDSPDEDIDETAGTAVLHHQYVVVASLPSQVIEIARGYVDLYMVRYDGRWWIVRWEDRVDPNVGVEPPDQTGYTLGYRRLDSVSS